jgi:2'-5' RNA ligase
MNYFLGYFLDDRSRKQVIKQVNKISSIFSGMGIQVRWVKPSDYHLKIHNLQGEIGLVKRLILSKRINKTFNLPIKVSIGNIRLGINRNLKGLIYLEIDNGGNELRKLRYKMLKNLKIKDNVQFIPHVAIGRINKDLSRQETSNILKDIDNISKKTKKENIEFNINKISLVKVEEGSYEILKNFLASS